ncbi:hypothetical protein D9M68_617880 [compost metagenome]
MRNTPWLSEPSRWAEAQLSARMAATRGEVPWRSKMRASKSRSSLKDTWTLSLE